MSDIISEISRISEDELRMQIALIDNVNISNAVKETGYRLVNVLADVANSFTQNDIGNAFWKEIGWTKREDLNYYDFTLNEANITAFIQ